jgi:predicted metal-dependent enzyme (double-stranded beta helix superfamily)
MHVEPAFRVLKPRLDDAVRDGDPGAIAHKVKEALQETLACEGLDLPSRFRVARPDTYARRLLYRDRDMRYTVVVMTWGPGQGTALHDHAGLWCVECVVDGEMDVTQYDLVTTSGDVFRFERRHQIAAGPGSAGCLIPPYEYHTLANRSQAQSSITLHVYGGEMDHCHVFEPAGDGSYRRVTRQLSYHE